MIPRPVAEGFLISPTCSERQEQPTQVAKSKSDVRVHLSLTRTPFP